MIKRPTWNRVGYGWSREGEPKLMEASAMAMAGFFDLTTLFIYLFLIKETKQALNPWENKMHFKPHKKERIK